MKSESLSKSKMSGIGLHKKRSESARRRWLFIVKGIDSFVNRYLPRHSRLAKHCTLVQIQMLRNMV